MEKAEKSESCETRLLRSGRSLLKPEKQLITEPNKDRSEGGNEEGAENVQRKEREEK
jgi:hypothetical protein